VADETHDARPTLDQYAGGGAVLVRVFEEGKQRLGLLVDLCEKVLAWRRGVQPRSALAAVD